MRLFIVSNRLPVTVVKRGGAVELREAVGGLATAIKSFLRATDGGKSLGFSEVVWVGWSGMRAEDETEEVRARLQEANLVPVPLTNEEVDLFYEGFCNSTIWPLFHGFTVYTIFENRFWEAYVKVNQKYADAVASMAGPKDFVWVHDYHLMLMPGMLRASLPELSIGFFLHIPFPPAEIYQHMPQPWRNSILEGLLSSDLVGFHVHEYVNNFIRSVTKFLGHRAGAGLVYVGHRKVRVGAFPIGIDFERFYNSSRYPEVMAQVEEIRQKLRGLKIVFSIDRLDYTKGILNRLYAWERFLEGHPEWQRRASYILVVVPSRTGVPQYDAMKREIEREVGRINGRFGDVDWVPIIYISRQIPTPTLLALYNVADVALITPLKDGMNLVSKEYVASRSGCDGVLILSETAGAANELLEALIVNPNDVSEVASAIERALNMNKEEQCRRMKAMQERIRQHNVVKWAVDFIHSLANAASENLEALRASTARPVDSEAVNSILRGLESSTRRLFLLDYDGTLIPLYPYPYQAMPDQELTRLLRSLASLPNTYVAVVSGRHRDFLEAWLGNLPIYLIAEHGAYIREVTGEWVSLFPFDTAWRASVRKLMEEFAEVTPGAYVEEKEAAIVWHYRNAEPQVGEAMANRLVEALASLIDGTGASIIRGNKVVEVRPTGVNKGSAAKFLIEKLSPDFILAAGDDVTDEDMFKALPQGAFSIKVGRGETVAKLFVPSHRELRKLLSIIIKHMGEQ